MRTLRWIALSLVATSLAACAWWMAGRRTGPERLAFSHELHASNDVPCEQCHNGVADSTNLQTSYLPVQSACTDCHEPGTCEVCSQLPEKRGPVEPDEMTIAFSHKDHMPRVNGDCTTCHGNAKTATELPVQTPPMARCLACHNHAKDYEEARCLGCHPELRRMPLDAVAEFNHGGNWIERHGTMSRAQGATCQECHPQAFCTECHSRVAPAAPARLYPEQVARTLIHRGDWLSTHFIDARAEGGLCLRCHEANYCQECHESFGLKATGGNASPHPPESQWLVKGSGNFHGDEARAHIESCQACHDQGASSNCVTCHRVGGPGGNPHPDGWGGSHDLDDTREKASCRACHGT